MPTYAPLYLAGIDCFNRQAFFESHEIWEDLWNDSQGETRRFYQGLIQAAVALHHHSQGNQPGAERLLARAVEHLQPFTPRCLGLDVDRFLSELSQCVQSASPSPALSPTIRLDPLPDGF